MFLELHKRIITCGVRCLPDMIRTLKWAGHIACVGYTRNTPKILVTYNLEAESIDRSIILKWMINKQDVRLWTRFNWLRTGSCG